MAAHPAPTGDRPTDAERSYGELVAARYAFDTPSPPVDSKALTSALAMGSPPSTLRLMLQHRSCRQYRDEPLDDELLDLLLAAAFSTPSKSDLQQCSVIVVDDPARRAAIGELIPTMPWILQASRFLVFCGDSRRVRRVAEHHGVPFANDHLDAVLNAAGDAAMHLSSFIWAAESIGLGTCPISVIRNHIDEVADIVELPDHVFPFAGMCVGWPERLRRFSPRLPPSVTVHHDRYTDADAADLIADYDRRRAGGYQPPPDQQVDVDRWGPAEFYGWSIEKARMVGRRERDQLARFLSDRGFGLG
jgi:nitroreductase/FMN reductase [NAD(P)H]